MEASRPAWLRVTLSRASSGVKIGEVLVPKSENKVLRVNFVDVQQGDGSVIESPSGQIILVDGGDNQLFARYLAGRFTDTTLNEPKPIECILVSHGDADHFVGLPEILKSETNKNPRKRLFMQPNRIYHNGIVKRPSKRNGKSLPEKELLGPTKKVGDDLFLVGLVDNLLAVPDAEMNVPFKTWKKTLAKYHKRAPLEFKRLQFGDDDAFDFLADKGIRIEVLGPVTIDISGKPALKFLGEPPMGPRVDGDRRAGGEGSLGFAHYQRTLDHFPPGLWQCQLSVCRRSKRRGRACAGKEASGRRPQP